MTKCGPSFFVIRICRLIRHSGFAIRYCVARTHRVTYHKSLVSARRAGRGRARTASAARRASALRAVSARRRAGREFLVDVPAAAVRAPRPTPFGHRTEKFLERFGAIVAGKLVRRHRSASPHRNRPGRFRRYCIRLLPAPQPFWAAVGLKGAPQKSGEVHGCHRLLVNRWGWCAAHGLTSKPWHPLAEEVPLFCGAPGVRIAGGRTSAAPWGCPRFPACV